MVGRITAGLFFCEFNNSVVGLILIVVTLSQLARRRRPGPSLATATALSMMVNGNFLLVSLTAIAQPRYTHAMWSGMVAYCVYAAVASVRWHRARRRPTH